MAGKRPITLAADRDPWDRQPGESLRQYSRFETFRELGRTRTLRQAAETLNTLGDKISYRTLLQYAYEHRWTERAEAADRKADQAEAVRLAQARRDMLDRHRRLAGGLTAKAVAALQAFQPVDLRPADVVRFLTLAAELERKAIGEPDTSVAVSGPGGGPVVVDDLSRYTPEERERRLRAIVEEFQRRAAVDDDGGGGG